MEHPAARAGTPWGHLALVALLGFFFPFLTLNQYGYTIDEATQLWAAREQRLWFAELPQYGTDSLSRQRITARWHFLEPPFSAPPGQHSHFHFPGSVYVINAGWLLGVFWLDDLSAHRLGSVLLFTFLLVMVFFGLDRAWGRASAWVGVLALLCSPRIFGHAHIAATETPLCAFWVLTLLLIARTARTATGGWGATMGQAALFGLLVGVTVSCKLTGALLVFPTAFWLLLWRPARWYLYFLAALLLAPLVLVIFTPPLWFDPLEGLLGYLRASARNPWKMPIYYLGTPYVGDLPWSSGLVLAALTMPVAILLGSIVGALAGWRDPLASLLLMNALTVITARCARLMPQHDGERQFLPFFYLAALLAAWAWPRVADKITRRVRWPTRRNALIYLFLCAIFAEPAWDTWLYRHHGLSYYNRMVGGLPGAAQLGLEVSYWFEGATHADWRALLADLPPKSRVFLRPDHPGLNDLKDWNVWRADLRSVGPAEADFFLLYGKRSAYIIVNPVTGAPTATDLMLWQERGPVWKEKRFLGVRFLALVKKT